jgi:hypothetical protein
LDFFDTLIRYREQDLTKYDASLHSACDYFLEMLMFISQKIHCKKCSWEANVKQFTKGYAGNILRVNLSAGNVTTEPLPEELVKNLVANCHRNGSS